MSLKDIKHVMYGLLLLILGANHVCSAENNATSTIACQIVRSRSNPFFDDMVKAASDKADELGMTLQVYETSVDGDVGGLAATKANVAHIEQCIADGALGILLGIAPDAPGTDLVAMAIESAKSKGVLVIALDSPLTGADATFMTNNTAAGYDVGRYAQLASSNSQEERIAILTCAPSEQHIFERLYGFVKGFGLESNYTGGIVLEEFEEYASTTDGVDYVHTDERVIATREVECSLVSSGKSAMMDILDAHRGDETPTIVYAVNEVAAYGALEALEEAGLDGEVGIVTIDGSCAGIATIEDGGFQANYIQHPQDMGIHGVEAIADYVSDGNMPRDVYTFSVLAASERVDGESHLSPTEVFAGSLCWGPTPTDEDGDVGGDTVDAGEEDGMDATSSCSRLMNVLMGSVSLAAIVTTFIL